jgi:hypothetical protein
MQKLDMNTVAQGIKRDFKDFRNEFLISIGKPFNKLQTVTWPDIFPVGQSYTIRRFWEASKIGSRF